MRPTWERRRVVRSCPPLHTHSCPMRWSQSLLEKAPYSSNYDALQDPGLEQPFLSRTFVEPSDGLEPSPPSLPSRVVGKRWQRPAARRKDLCGFWRVAPCPWLRLFASALLHKCSTQAAGVGAALGCEAV